MALMIVGEVISLFLASIFACLFFPIAIAGDLANKNAGMYFLLYFFIMAVVNCIFSIIGRRSKKKSIMIINIITSIFSLVFFNGIGAEWGLRAIKRDKKLNN